MVSGPAALKREGIYIQRGTHVSPVSNQTRLPLYSPLVIICTHLRSRTQRSIQSHVPHRVIVNLGQIGGDLHRDFARGGRNLVDDLHSCVEIDRVGNALRVVPQPDRVVTGRIFGERVSAVRGRFAIPTQLDFLAGAQGRILGDALVYVDAGIVALAPG